MLKSRPRAPLLSMLMRPHSRGWPCRRQRLPTLLQKKTFLFPHGTSFQPPAMALMLDWTVGVAPYAYRVPPDTGVSYHWDTTHCLLVSEGLSGCQWVYVFFCSTCTAQHSGNSAAGSMWCRLVLWQPSWQRARA
jgi:hypothetical protein